MAVEVGQSEPLKVAAQPAVTTTMAEVGPQQNGVMPGASQSPQTQAIPFAGQQPPGTPTTLPIDTPARAIGKPPPGTDPGKKTPPADPGKPETGVGKHYLNVELTPPPGASPALKSFVKMAETAIQTAVDMLGRGTMKPPPNLNEVLTTKVITALGKGAASDAYNEALIAVDARQTNLLTLDGRVLETAFHVAEGKDRTREGIKAVVEKLQSVLKSAGTGKLKSADEIRLMKEIAAALDEVYRRVAAAAQLNADMAGKGKSGTGNGDNSGNGTANNGSGGDTGANNGGAANGTNASAGGGDGGLGALGQMLPMLGMMLPMGVMALAPIVQQVIQSNQRQHEQQLQAAPGTAQPGAPGDPAAQPGPPAAAAPAADPAPAPPNVEPAGVAGPDQNQAPASSSGSTPPGTNPAPVGAAPPPPANSGAPSVTPPNTGSIPGAPVSLRPTYRNNVTTTQRNSHTTPDDSHTDPEPAAADHNPTDQSLA